jgi:hypothetical protein
MVCLERFDLCWLDLTLFDMLVDANIPDFQIRVQTSVQSYL